MRGIDSQYSLEYKIRAIAAVIRAEWNTLQPSNQMSVFNVTPNKDSDSAQSPGLHMRWTVESEYDEVLMKDVSVLKINTLINANRYLSKFVRDNIFIKLGLDAEAKAERKGWIPLISYPSNSDSGELISVETVPGRGWKELLPGDASRIIDDPQVLNHVAYLMLTQ